jgi:hypothetical protein
MKLRSLRFLAAACLFGPSLWAEGNPFTELVSPFPPSTVVLEAPDAETAWALIEKMSTMEGLMAAAAASGATTQQGRMDALMLHLLEVVGRATTFMQRFPEHPQRWRAVQIIASFPDEVANEDGTPKREIEGFTWDVPKFQQFRRQVAELAVASQSAPDAPAEVRLSLELGLPGGLQERMALLQRAIRAGETADLTPVREEILRLAEKYPETEMVRNFVSIYSQYLT